MMNRFFSYFLLLYSINCYSQNDIIAELSKSTRAYLSADNFSAEVKVTGYQNRNSGTGMLLGTGKLCRAKNSYYSRFSTDEMISNEHCTIIVDRLEKSITYFESGKIPRQQWDDKNSPMLDSNMIKRDSIVYLGLKEGLKCYSVFSKRGDIKQTDIFINPKDHFVRKIIYYYNDSQSEDFIDMDKVVIEYNNVSVNNVDKNYFSEKRFVRGAGSKISLTSEFSGYELFVINKNEAP